MKTLLIAPNLLNLEKMVAQENQITFFVRSIQAQILCPGCRQRSTRVHSRYIRVLTDLPWEGITVRIRLKVRRFFCMNASCPKALFCERLPELAGRYARQTVRLDQAFCRIGLIAGGEAGAQVLEEMGVGVSADTLLRRIRSAPPRETAELKVLGVDDWAKKRGQRYGTILVDLERHRVVDLLPDRESGTLATWLKQRPGIEIISRDRAGAYADGSRQGAPNATQIADRWHIHKNLTEAVERVLQTKSSFLRKAAKEMQERTALEDIPQSLKSEIDRPSKLDLWNERRRQQYEDVRVLWRQGATIKGIARHFGMHRRTVKMLITAESCPERLSPGLRSSQLDRHMEYLAQRWSEGCHNSAELYRGICQRGFHGSESSVRHAVAQWRNQLPPELRRGRRGPAIEKPVSPRKKILIPSARQTAWLLLQKEEKLEEEQKAYLIKLQQLSPEITELQKEGQRFSRILREKDVKDFDSWLKDASGSQFPEIKSFANGIVRDRKAVEASLIYKWSNGQTEGQVNRLKTLKRQMYGRAKVDLLKARMLGVP